MHKSRAKVAKKGFLDNLIFLYNFIINKFYYWIIIIFSLLGIYYFNKESSPLYYVRAIGYNVVAEVYESLLFISSPIQNKYNQLIDEFFDWHYGDKKKISITTPQDELAIALLKSENAQLKKLNNYAWQLPEYDYVSARAISISANAFGKSFLINAGRDNGIKKGSAVINESGLIGRIIEVNNKSARVLLLTEMHFKVPAIFLSSNINCLAIGSNSLQLDLNYLSDLEQILEGDILITSGEGGVVPYGIKIGHAKFINGNLKIEPSVNFNNITIVSVFTEKLN